MTSDDTGASTATEALLSLSRVMTAVVARTLADVGEIVTIPQLRILVMLYYGGPMNLSAVAHGLGVARSNASRPADKLVTGGLVRRREDESDRRSVVLSLTAQGRRLVESTMEQRRQIFDALVAQMPEGDRERLTRGVGALLDVVRHDEAVITGTPTGSILRYLG